MTLLADPARASELSRLSQHWPSLTLNPIQVSVLELLLVGALSPLDSFMDREACEACIARMRLPGGAFWPLPITLDVAERPGAACEPGSSIVLRDREGLALAILHVGDRWQPDRRAESHALGLDPAADAAAAMPWRLGGRIEGLAFPRHTDFAGLRRSPSSIRLEVNRRGWPTLSAYQTGALMHRRQVAATREALTRLGGGLLIQALLPAFGPVDARQYGRVRAWENVLPEYDGLALLQLLQLPETPGARGSALRALVAGRCGCTHLLVRTDPWPGWEGAGIDSRDLGIVPVAIHEDGDLTEASVDALLGAGEQLPADFTFPAVARELHRLMPPRWERGLTIWFTGLPGAGKSTLANAVRVALLARGDRSVTLLDGDLVRQGLSSELGFSREHRDLNVRRIGLVAQEITRHGGIAICAPISPYDSTRREIRHAIESVGAFVLVFVDTPLDVCAQRDPKGLYAKAQAGLIREFTGVSDPYERPSDSDLVVDTSRMTAAAAVETIVRHLESTDYLRSARAGA